MESGTYTAAATGLGGTTIATRTITVVQPSPTLTLQAAPATIMNG